MSEKKPKLFNYKVTDDFSFLEKDHGVTPKLKKLLTSLHDEVTEYPKKSIKKLSKLIKEYPKNPQLKNYLSVAYSILGNNQKVLEIAQRIQTEHPNYLYGKLSLAAIYFQNGEFEKIPEILGKSIEIQALFPERNLFHIDEVIGFNYLAIKYFITIDNLEAAKSRLTIMEDIYPDNPETEEAAKIIMYANLKKSLQAWKDKDESKIKVIPPLNILPDQITEPPAFTNPVINKLYENNFRISQDLIHEILALPRKSLIADLELILNDLLVRYDFFRDEVDEFGWDENQMNFSLHALFLLGELKAENSLPKVMEIFRQDYDFLEFWFSDHITETLWEPIYYLGNNQIEELKQFIQEPGLDTYAKSLVSSAISQIPFHQPQRRYEVISWYKEIFKFFINTKIEENIIDSDFISFLVSDVIEFNATSLTTEIKKLFNLGYVSVGITGDFKTVLKDLEIHSERNYKKELVNIYDRYHIITNTWAGYQEENTNNDYDIKYDDYEDLPAILPVHKEQKIGRNDPCPCGSGKKYKRCCLTKNI